MNTFKGHAERMVELWDEVDKAFHNKYKQSPNTAQAIAIFTRADHHIISDAIGEQKKGQQQQQKSKKDQEGYCNKCGRQLTDKEVYFIEKNDQDEICYHCSH